MAGDPDWDLLPGAIEDELSVVSVSGGVSKLAWLPLSGSGKGWNGVSGGRRRGRFGGEFGWMLRQPGSGTLGIDVVGGKAPMMARNVSPEVSLRPKMERIGGQMFYISCLIESSYSEHMTSGFKGEVQSVKSTECS
jgi:hypothetical protein